MSSPNDLTTIEEALAWLGTATDPGYVARLITAVSTTIQKWLGYNILQSDYTTVFDGMDTTKIFLPVKNVTAVSQVIIGSLLVPASAAPAVGSTQQPGFVFDTKAVSLIGYRFCRGTGNVSISYTAGYSTVPGDVEQACLDMIKMANDRYIRTADLAQIIAGQTQNKYQDLEKTPGASMPVPPSVRVALQPYVLVWPGMA